MVRFTWNINLSFFIIYQNFNENRGVNLRTYVFYKRLALFFFLLPVTKKLYFISKMYDDYHQILCRCKCFGVTVTDLGVLGCSSGLSATSVDNRGWNAAACSTGFSCQSPYCRSVMNNATCSGSFGEWSGQWGWQWNSSNGVDGVLCQAKFWVTDVTEFSGRPIEYVGLR